MSVDVVRGLVRPFVTVLFSVSLVVFVGYDLFKNGVSVPQWYQVIASSAVLWWYYDRTTGKKIPPVDK